MRSPGRASDGLVVFRSPRRLVELLVPSKLVGRDAADNYPVSKAVSVAEQRRNGWWAKQTVPVAGVGWPALAPIRAVVKANSAAKAVTRPVWYQASPGQAS